MRKIAFFCGQLQLDSQRKVLEGIVDAARKDGNSVYVYSLTLTMDDDFNFGEAATVLKDDLSVYDGFIIYEESIYSAKIRDLIISRLKEYDKPGASIDCYIPGMINVSSDNEAAMTELSRHLIHEHGVRTVNFVSGPDDSIDAMTRKRVFVRELEETGVKFDEERCFVGDFYARSGRYAVEYYEEKGLLDADAYVCANDQMALGVFYALEARGIRVPEDTFLTGYDNIFEAANHYPRITSVNRSEEKLGEIAYENLIKAIEGEPYEESPYVPSQAVFAESCGCPLRRPVSHRTVVNENARSRLTEVRYAEMVSDISIELTSAQNIDDINDVLKKYVPDLGGDAFCFAYADGQEPTGKINLRIGIKYFDHGFADIDGKGYIDRNELDDNTTGGNCFIINALHYREKLSGFIVIRNSIMPLETEFYRIFAMNLSNAMEQVDNLTKMRQMIKTLDEMWVFDPLTHIYNRAGFFKFADEIVHKSRTLRQDMFFLFLDLDGLKTVNDVYGHEQGDKMICEMADILRKTRQKEDLLMRYGGDEFVVFGKGISESELNEKVEEIRRAMAEANEKEDRKYMIDASIGSYIVPYSNSLPISQLIELADQEMYKEKREKHRRRPGN